MMYKKLFLAVLSLVLVSSAWAIENNWMVAAESNDWFTAANWSQAYVPRTSDSLKTRTYETHINTTYMPVINSGDAEAYQFEIGGDSDAVSESKSIATLTINGGTLSISDYIRAGASSTSNRWGALYVNGGTVTVGTYLAVGYGVTTTDLRGWLYMTGGTINVTNAFTIGKALGASGRVYLSGGTINAASLAMKSDAGTHTGTVLLDISDSGSVVLTGNKVSTVQGYIDSGWITAYDGTGTVEVDYDVTTSGKTTITASSDPPPVPDKASVPSPANSAATVSTTDTLSWTGSGATSYDVYFGTDSTPDDTGLQGNQSGTTFDPGTMALSTTYYWRIDSKNATGTTEGDVWSFYVNHADTAVLLKGPYLIYPGTNTEMTVLWQLDLTAACTLEWGLTTAYSTGSTTTTEYGSDHQHKYTITSLTPGTKYYYRVTIGGTEETGSFYAAPSSSATSVKFFMYGDTRSNGSSHNSVANRMVSTYTADSAYQTMVLHAGDWVNSDGEVSWTDEWYDYSWTKIVDATASMPIMGTIGNHEGSGSSPVFEKYRPFPFAATPADYFSFDYGPVHVTVVDQYTTYTNPSTQYTWLVNDLSTTTKSWKIIVLHQPGWSCNGGHTNDTTVQSVIQPLCEQYGVQIVLAGHNHYYSRADVSGVQHLTHGGGGAPLYTPVAGEPNIVTYSKSLAVSKVVISGNTLTCTTVNSTGTVLDTFTVNKASDDGPDFTFVQASDPQIGWSNCTGVANEMDYKWGTTISKINLINPAFMIVTGDLVDSSTSDSQVATYKSYLAGLDPAIEYYEVPGNHDISEPTNQTKYNRWASNYGYGSEPNAVPWYSFTYGDSIFIGLDSVVLRNPSGFTDPNRADEEIDWLTQTLIDANEAGYTHKFVFMHHPLFIDSVTETYAETSSRSIPEPRRTELRDLFQEYGVDAVFSGHTHTNEYVLDGDMELITTSSCTCGLGSPRTEPGILVIKVYSDRIEQEYRTLDSIGAKFGNYDGLVNVKRTLQDSNGNNVTFTLTGGGYGEMDDSDSTFSAILLHNTTMNSILTIKTVGKIETSIGSITVGDDDDANGLKSIVAATTNLRGSITVYGGLGALTLGDVADDHTITIGEYPDPSKNTAGVKMKFDQVADTTIDSQLPIKSLTATEWLGGSIDAPSVGTISITGKKAPLIAGDLDADVTLDSTINSVTAKGTLSGEWTCSSIKSVTAPNLDGADITLNLPPDLKLLALGKLTASGTMDSSQIQSTGNIGTVSVGKMQDSICFAGVTEVDDVDANDGVLDLPDPAADINDGTPTISIKSITIKGIKGSADPNSFINSNVAAAQILSASLYYPKYDNDGAPFGLASDYIKTLKIKDATRNVSFKALDVPEDSNTVEDFEVSIDQLP